MAKKVTIKVNSELTIPADELEHFIDEHMPIPLSNKVELLNDHWTVFEDKKENSKIQVEVTNG